MTDTTQPKEGEDFGPQWEIVQQEAYTSEQTTRLPVPDGWLYRYSWVEDGKWNCRMVFVPNPVKGWSP